MLSRSFFVFVILVIFMTLMNCSAKTVKLEAGATRVNLTPDILKHQVALGGYGDRNGKPAIGIRDSVFARALVIQRENQRFCLVSAELDFIPASLKEEVLQRLQKMPENPFNADNLMLAATHTHAGPTGFAMMPENSFDNPRLGIFDPYLLDFTADAISRAVRQALQKLEPAKIGSGRLAVDGLTRNRRGNQTIDPDLTLVKFSSYDGKLLAVLMNFTAHVTIVNPEFMEISGGWAGVLMQHFENSLADQPIVLFTNGAEGDQSPVAGNAAETYARVCDYAAKLQPHFLKLLDVISADAENTFKIVNRTVDLPDHQISRTFALTAGDEYQVPTESLIGMVQTLFPSKVRLTGVQLGDFALVGIPGEMMTALGLKIKQAFHQQNIEHPVICGLTDEYVGYILSAKEYQKGGYEAAVSFYGEILGDVLVNEAVALTRQF